MKFKISSLVGGLFLCSIFVVNCGGDSNNVVNPDDIECYIAFNSLDNSFVKIVNTLNRKVDAKMLLRHPMAALIDERSCALMGVMAGVSDQVRLLEFKADGSCCGDREKTVPFRLEADNTLTIIVDDEFFR